MDLYKYLRANRHLLLLPVSALPFPAGSEIYREHGFTESPPHFFLFSSKVYLSLSHGKDVRVMARCKLENSIHLLVASLGTMAERSLVTSRSLQW